MTARGDSQSHAEYARRMFGWTLSQTSGDLRPDLERFFDGAPDLVFAGR
jgi:hypothetical protein